MSTKSALIIANADYADSKLARLAAPSKDAETLAAILKAPELAAFDNVLTVINGPEPTARRAIAKFFASRQADDLLLLYFSGHGVRDDQGRLFLAMTDTDSSMLDASAISADFVTRQMDNSRSKRQVLILDCCNSGAFASGIKAAAGMSMGTATAFEGSGYGRVVLTASDATQFAWEGDKVIGEETSNSLFTHFLVQGLEGEADANGDGIITVDELYDFAYNEIVKRTPKQTPGKWAYKEQGQIILTTKVKPQTIKPQPLDPDLEESLISTRNYIREAAVNELCAILHGPNLGRALSAELRLQYVAENDDSRAIAHKAAQLLEEYRASRAVAGQVQPAGPLAAEQAQAQAGALPAGLQSLPVTQGTAPKEPAIDLEVPPVSADTTAPADAAEAVPHEQPMPSQHGWQRYVAIAAIGLIALGSFGALVRAVQNKASVTLAPSQIIQTPLSTSGILPPTVAAIPILPEASPTPPLGTWNIEYFASTGLISSAASSVAEPAEQNNEGGYTLQFSSTKLPQDPDIPRKNFSMRLIGSFYFSGGMYEFHCEHQDGCRISVDGTTWIDGWHMGSDSDQVTGSVSEGNHRVDIEFYDKSGQGFLKVLWRIRPTPTPTPTLTATCTPTRTPMAAPAKKKRATPCLTC